MSTQQQTVFLHEMTFETKEQAEMAAKHLSNVEQVQISDVSEEVQFFVDVPQAFDLQFRTTYALDERVQAVLRGQNGLIPEMPPKFNTDAESADEEATIWAENLERAEPKTMSLDEYNQARKEHRLTLDAQITLTVREMIAHERQRTAAILGELKPDLKKLWAEETLEDAHSSYALESVEA